MNYILIQHHYETEILDKIINNIINLESANNVILVTNEKWKKRKYNTIPKSELISNSLIKAYKPLGVPRILILKQIFEKFQLNKAVHFDEDVLLLKRFYEIKSLLVKNKINITSVNFSKFSYGFSYFDSIEILEDINKKYLENCLFYSKKLEFDKKRVTEGKILKNIYFSNNNLFNILPVIPLEHNVVFDPISYGRYLIASSSIKKKIMPGIYRYLDEEVGIDISAKRLNIYIKKNDLKLEWNNKSFELAALKTFGNKKLINIV